MSITSFVVLAICAAAATTAKGEDFQEHTYMFSLTPGYSSFFTKDKLDMYMFSRTQGKVNLTDSSLDKDIYTAYMEEETFEWFGRTTCTTIESLLDTVPAMCYVNVVYDDSKVYCNYTENKAHATKCASMIMTRNVYEFELTADGTTPEGIKFIDENGLKIPNASSIVDYTFTQNTTYFVGAAEKTEGDFGNTVAEAFGENATFKNYVTLVKDEKGKTYFALEEGSSKGGVAAFAPVALSVMALIAAFIF